MRRPFLLSIIAWLGVWDFWFVVTRSFHPTMTLAMIVTTSLVVAYAAAAYLNHLLLIPKFWSTGRWGIYFAALLVVMASLTALALAVIRVSYITMLGPDLDRFGLYKHFAIDFVGMVVHVLAAAIVVNVFRRWNRGSKAIS